MAKGLTHLWRDYEPPSLCHFDFGITEALAAVGLSSAAEAGTAAASTAAIAEAAGSTAAGLSAGEAAAAAASLPEVIGAAAAPAATGGIGSSLATIGSYVGPIASAGGTLLQAKAGADQAAYQEAVARYGAQAAQQKADQDAAAGQQTAISRDRQRQYIENQYRARAAAGGAVPAGEDTVLTQIGEQGTKNTLAALYDSMNLERADRQQGALNLYQAGNIGRAAPLATLGTVLAGAGSLADRAAYRRYLARTGESPLSGFA